MLTRTVFGRTFTFSHCVGRGGGGGSGFSSPMDVAFGTDGVVYVLSRSPEVNPSSRVSKVSLGDRSGEEEFILQFGGHGSANGEFLRTTSLALDKDENVYVADEYLNRISIFDKLGNYLGSWGTPGSGEGEINRPWGRTFDREDYLWMVDSGNSRVQVFTKDGKFLHGWGREGSGDGEFDMPWGIAIDGQGDVYVADWRNHRVQKFNPDGKHLMSFGAPGSGQGELLHPSGVAIDEEGDVYAVDWAGSQVHAYGPDGSYLTTFMGDAQELSLWAQWTLAADAESTKARKRVESLEPEWRFYYPTAVGIDDKRRIVIVDQQRSRLQVYIKEKDYVEPQFNL